MEHRAIYERKTKTGKFMRGSLKRSMPSRAIMRTYSVDLGRGESIEAVDAMEIQRLSGGRWRRDSLTRLVRESQENPERWNEATGLDEGYIIRKKGKRSIHFPVETAEWLLNLSDRYVIPLTDLASDAGLNETELHGGSLDKAKISWRWFTTPDESANFLKRRAEEQGVLRKSYAMGEAGAKFGKKGQTVARWVDVGVVPHVIDGALKRVPKEFVDANAAAVRSDPKWYYKRRAEMREASQGSTGGHGTNRGGGQQVEKPSGTPIVQREKNPPTDTPRPVLTGSREERLAMIRAAAERAKAKGKW